MRRGTSEKTKLSTGYIIIYIYIYKGLIFFWVVTVVKIKAFIRYPEIFREKF